MGETTTVHGLVWRAGQQIEKDFELSQLATLLADHELLTWVDICAPQHELLAQLATELALDPLAVEDAVAHGERPKVTRYGTYMFMTVYGVTDPDQAGEGGVEAELGLARVSAFVLPRGVVTVRSSTSFDMDQVIARWTENADLLQYGVGALVHGLLDVVVDGHFEAVQTLDDAIEDVEDILFDQEQLGDAVQRRTYGIRKQLVDLRRVVLPMREVVNAVLRHRKEFHAPTELDPWYDDLYDHVLRATEWTESLRDMVSTIFETNLSLQDARLNNVMKKLTSWAAIIAVPTAITGYFGQNVPYPGINHTWGFVLSTVSILVIALALYFTFKRKQWL